MKKLFTLGALGLLSATTALAQAPTIDGMITAAEKGTGPGRYQSMGMFTNNRGFGPWGLIEAFVTNDANNLYIAIQGTVEPNPGDGNSFQIWFNVASQNGIPSGTAVPLAPSLTGDPTSFDGEPGANPPANSLGRFDFQIDGAAGFRYAGGVPQMELASFSTPVPASQILGQMDEVGGAFTFLAGAARAAYKKAPTDVTSNTNEGLEVSIAMAPYGIAPGQTVQLFILQNNRNGGYASSDFIPQGPVVPNNPGDPNNMGPEPDFTASAGNQFFNYVVQNATGLPKLDESAINFTVSPNPVSGTDAQVAFTVADKAQTATVIVTDLLGREVAVLANGTLPVGQQRFSLKSANLASGQYLVKLMLGDKVATRKVSVL